MGTMRKMENQELEEKMMATKDSRLSAPPNGMTIPRKRILGGGGGGRISKVAIREVDKWKRVAAQKAGGRQRQPAALSTVAAPAITMNGHKVSSGHRAAPRESPGEVISHHQAIDADATFYKTENRQPLQPEDNLPMDLSKRSVEEDAGQEWRDDEMEDAESYRSGADNDGYDITNENDRTVARADEPLNLSRPNAEMSGNNHHHRWNGHHSGESSDEHQSANSYQSATRPELLQKRVRLENTVSYIRKCSAPEESPSQRHHHLHRLEPEDHHHRNNGSHEWSHTNGNHRVRHYYQRHPAAAVDEGGSDDDVYHNRDGSELEDHEEEMPGNGHHLQSHHRRPEYNVREEIATPPSYQHHHHLHRRRKSSTPYRGTPTSNNLSPGGHRLLHRRSNAISHLPDDYDYEEAEVDQPVRPLVVPGNGLHGISYPVLRQQLLGNHKRHLVPTNERESDDHMSAHEENGEDDIVDQPDVVKGHSHGQRRRRHRPHARHPNDLDEDDVDDDRHSSDAGNHGNQPLLTQQHLHLLTATAPPIGSQEFMTWSNYAYYANLLQGLQGTLAAAGTNSLPGSLPNLPLTLSLPLSVRGSGPRSESPGSIEEDDDPNTLDLSSPETLSHKNNGVKLGCATNNHKNNGTSGGGLVGIATDVAAANAAMFRKRAPRALTGKHVKHGTGASPTTLLTLRQKIEQKRQQQLASSATIKPSGGGGVQKLLQEKSKSSESNGALHKAIKSGTLMQKKAIAS